MKQLITIVLKNNDEVNFIFNQDKLHNIKMAFDKNIVYKNTFTKEININASDIIVDLTAYLFTFLTRLKKENDIISSFYYGDLEPIEIFADSIVMQTYLNGSPVTDDTAITIHVEAGKDNNIEQEEQFLKVTVNEIKNSPFEKLFNVEQIQVSSIKKNGIPQNGKSKSINKILFFSGVELEKIPHVKYMLNMLVPYLKLISDTMFELEFSKINLNRLANTFMANKNVFRSNDKDAIAELIKSVLIDAKTKNPYPVDLNTIYKKGNMIVIKRQWFSEQ